eukprot:7366118-Ditylum_brightwellii.AAC.1
MAPMSQTVVGNGWKILQQCHTPFLTLLMLQDMARPHDNLATMLLQLLWENNVPSEQAAELHQFLEQSWQKDGNADIQQQHNKDMLHH